MKNIFFVIIALTFIGFFDAGYLTYEHYSLAIPPCSLHSWFSDCGVVLTSKYSTVFGMPVALFGALYYIVAFVLSVYALISTGKNILHVLFVVVSLGALTALYFIVLQLFILHAICPYCMLSDVNCLVIFGLCLKKILLKNFS